MPDPDRLARLVSTVGAFHITDRAMRSAQERMSAALGAGTVDATAKRAYVDAVLRYFGPYEREAQGQLKQVDRELERLYQLQYNYTAERGVVAKRVEAVRGVLGTVEELRDE